jgi:magnesium transporter
MNRQIVDTQGLKVVRVNDLKLSEYGNQLRLLGAEVGIRGLLRGLSPFLEKLVCKFCKLIKKPLHEQLIA